jgi:hypothetical protein
MKDMLLKALSLHIEAMTLLIFLKVSLTVLSFKNFSKLYNYNGLNKKTLKNDLAVRRINSAINRCCRHIPWENKCLIRAAAIKVMLNNRGIKNELHLGVIKKNEALKAHAWIDCDGEILVRADEQEKFTKIYSYN